MKLKAAKAGSGFHGKLKAVKTALHEPKTKAERQSVKLPQKRP